jgi:hypothetical protein
MHTVKKHHSENDNPLHQSESFRDLCCSILAPTHKKVMWCLCMPGLRTTFLRVRPSSRRLQAGRVAATCLVVALRVAATCLVADHRRAVGRAEDHHRAEASGHVDPVGRGRRRGQGTYLHAQGSCHHPGARATGHGNSVHLHPVGPVRLRACCACHHLSSLTVHHPTAWPTASANDSIVLVRRTGFCPGF